MKSGDVFYIGNVVLNVNGENKNKYLNPRRKIRVVFLWEKDDKLYFLPVLDFKISENDIEIKIDDNNPRFNEMNFPSNSSSYFVNIENIIEKPIAYYKSNGGSLTNSEMLQVYHAMSKRYNGKRNIKIKVSKAKCKK